jgi:hypothetical protein
VPIHSIVCPECLTPATKWFEFGGSDDRHGYYHCDGCEQSCAVQELGNGRFGRQSSWVREALGAGNSRTRRVAS